MGDLSATIAGVRIDPCIMNAAGPFSETSIDLQLLAQSQVGAIVTKSMTIVPRAGNPEPRCVQLHQGSLNAMGLPNAGVDAYCLMLPEIRAAGHGQPVIASIAGFSPQEYMIAVDRVAHAGFDLIELNLSCPNVLGHGIIGYDTQTVGAILNRVLSVASRPVGIKLPPFLDQYAVELMAATIRSTIEPAFITLTNTLGLATAINAETHETHLHARAGYGGLAGKALKPVALANVRMFHERLPNIPIIGVGGISTGYDVIEYLLAGATAVQIGTAFMTYDLSIFSAIVDDLERLVEESVADLIGMVRVGQPYHHATPSVEK